MDFATLAHTETRGEEFVCLKEMRGVGFTLKRTLVKRKKTCFIFSVSFSVSLSIFLSVEGSRSVQQPADKSK